MMAEEIRAMLQAGVIESSTSPWRAPVVLAKKKDGSARFCVDFRQLNAVTVSDAYPIPLISDLLQLSGMRWFATLDLRSGFWQVPMARQDREKTAFEVPGEGFFQFTRMPFGLKNATATFQRIMEKTLEGIPQSWCRVYVDDILVCGSTVQELVEHLALVAQRLIQAGLKVSARKCKFFKRSAQYLGHIISERGITASPSNILVIQNWPVPSCQREIQGFNGTLLLL